MQMGVKIWFHYSTKFHSVIVAFALISVALYWCSIKISLNVQVFTGFEMSKMSSKRTANISWSFMRFAKLLIKRPVV